MTRTDTDDNRINDIEKTFEIITVIALEKD